MAKRPTPGSMALTLRERTLRPQRYMAVIRTIKPISAVTRQSETRGSVPQLPGL